MTILFEPTKHLYIDQDDALLKFKSVSSVLNFVKPPFDPDGSILKKYSSKSRDFIIKDLAKKWELTIKEANDKWDGIEFNEASIKKIWDEKKKKSLDRGTKLHAHKENISLKKGYFPIIYDEQTGYKKSYDLTNLSNGTYPELIIYNLSHLLVGTADIVTIYPNNTFEIKDYKTNVKIDFEGFKVFNPENRKKESRKLLKPVNHLDDCDGLVYSLQLSFYAYMLEQFGYECKKLTIIHIQTDAQDNITMEVEYPINYLKKEIITILNYLKTKSNE